MAGWIKIHRDIQNHWISQDMTKLGWWVDLLLQASYEDHKVLVRGEVVEVKRGQMIASLSFLAERWNSTKPTVQKFLKLLEGERMIYRSLYGKSTIVTICNYEDYQEQKRQGVNDSFTGDFTDRFTTALPTKEGKEDINYNIISTAPAYTHERDNLNAYAERYSEEGLWADVAVMAHLPSVDAVKAIFQDFIKEQQHNGNTYSGYQDFKSHFLNYARSSAERSRQQKIRESNGSNNNWQDKRRGVQVVAQRVADYEGSF